MEEIDDGLEKRGWKKDKVKLDPKSEDPWLTASSRKAKKNVAKAEKEKSGTRSPIRAPVVPPAGSRPPTLTRAQIKSNAKRGLKETHGAKNRSARPCGAKNQGSARESSKAKRGRFSSSYETSAPRKRPNTRDKLCVRSDPGLKTGTTILYGRGHSALAEMQ
jgi:hypothetical protein